MNHNFTGLQTKRQNHQTRGVPFRSWRTTVLLNSGPPGAGLDTPAPELTYQRDVFRSGFTIMMNRFAYYGISQPSQSLYCLYELDCTVLLLYNTLILNASLRNIHISFIWTLQSQMSKRSKQNIKAIFSLYLHY